MDPNLPKYICLPGPSKRKDNNNDNHQKKQKTDEEINTKISSVTIDDLPEEILVTIFKYLSIQDRLIAQRVCSRWQEVGKIETLWKCVKLSDISLPLLSETFQSLSSCVLHFELKDQFLSKLSFNVLQFISKLHEHCPSLKTLILRNINFKSNWTGVPYDYSIVFRKTEKVTHKYMQHFLLRRMDNMLNQSQHKCESNESFEFGDILFPELQILSLTEVSFDPLGYYYCFSGLVLPKITVLDLSNQKCFPLLEEAFFSTLANLKELYLCGWTFTNPDRLAFLKHLRKLRVLDLGNCLLSNDTIKVLIQNSTSLEELYLCFSNVQEIQRTDEEVFFPRLHTLCLKNTSITENNIRELLTVCSSLKFVNVSSFSSGITETSDTYKKFKEECNFLIFNEVDFCNHFSKRKYCCK